MTTSLRFLGIAAFEIVSETSRILIDPCLGAQPSPPLGADELDAPDVILVSHAAFDHLGDTAAIALRTGAPVVCGAEVRLKLLEEGLPPRQIRATTWGIVVRVGGVVIRPVECRHWSIATLADGRTATGNPLAFIVEPEPGLRIYHYGDTAIFDMRLIGELYRPDVAILGCSQPRELVDTDAAGEVLTGEMSPDEAARVAEMLGVRLAIACHYLDRGADTEAFLRLVGEHDRSGARVALAPDPGDRFLLDPGGVLAGERPRTGAI